MSCSAVFFVKRTLLPSLQDLLRLWLFTKRSIGLIRYNTFVRFSDRIVKFEVILCRVVIVIILLGCIPRYFSLFVLIAVLGDKETVVVTTILLSVTDLALSDTNRQVGLHTIHQYGASCSGLPISSPR